MKPRRKGVLSHLGSRLLGSEPLAEVRKQSPVTKWNFVIINFVMLHQAYLMSPALGSVLSHSSKILSIDQEGMVQVLL